MDAKSNPQAILTLPSDNEILIVRDFRARKAQVFDAWTKPEWVRNWYGCSDQTLIICSIDLREGGAWRWVLRDTGGGEHAFSGSYRTIQRPDRLVFTQRYEPVPSSDHTVALSFEERAAETTLSMRIIHASKQQRDGHLQAGMEVGLQDMWNRLEQQAISIAAAP